MSEVPPTAPAVFPPLRRDHRVHAWILSAAISQIGDMAWYVGLAWSAAQITTRSFLAALHCGLVGIKQDA